MSRAKLAMDAGELQCYHRQMRVDAQQGFAGEAFGSRRAGPYADVAMINYG